ncbi:MAG: transporter substrate-binding domain-containing protein [Flexilinea sp.]|nr:transporter substrate-binding domain-containing protein [Flexilinea sp.]
MAYRKKIFQLLSVLFVLLRVLPCAGDGEELLPEYSRAEEMSGAKVGLLTGMPFEDMIRAKIPDIGGFSYFASMPDEILALKGRKIDAIFINNALIDFAAAHNDDLIKMSEHYLDSSFGFAFPKGDPQRDIWQAQIDRLKEDGTIDVLWEKWMGGGTGLKTVPEQDWPGAGGTVRVACADSFEPMSYVGADKQMMGFDVEILLTIAKELDLKVEFTPMDFGSLMPTVQSGKADMAIGDIVITAERSEIMDFAPYAPAYFTMLIRLQTEEAEDNDFWSSLKGSFYRTFIKENRYRMVLSGLGITVLIAVSSGIIGTCMAFTLVYHRRRNIPTVNRLIDLYCSLIAGIPAAVILMVLYYIIFGSSEAPAVIVAIIGFALIFCARAFGVIWNAVCAVDKGQWEAALALGYDEGNAFRQVILPQSTGLYLQVLKSQFIMLLKETSVAGYISVLDLTRSGDLIRSRTMEAFFPLISIAAVYFLLTVLLTKLLGLIDLSLDRKHDSRKIKGVD